MEQPHHTTAVCRIYWVEALRAIRNIAMDPRKDEFATGDADYLEAIARDIRRANAGVPKTVSDLEMLLVFLKEMGFRQSFNGPGGAGRPRCDGFTIEHTEDTIGVTEESKGRAMTIVTVGEQHLWYFDENNRRLMIGSINGN